MTEEPDDSSAEQPQPVRSGHIGALVPAHVARGVFSTGVAVMQGPHEFVIDFLLQMQHPQQVVARVVLPPPVVGQLIRALADNIRKFESRFGPIPVPTLLPSPEQRGAEGSGESVVSEPGATEPPRATAEDLYDQLRLPEDVMCGRYANAVMIGHSASEFSFDFITTFFPRSAVVQRVFLSAANVPRLLDSLRNSLEQYQKRLGGTSGTDSGHPENN